MKARSAKQTALYVQRRQLVAELLAAHPWCQVPDCPRPATVVHEALTRARGGSITDRSNCRMICDPHHAEIHTEEPAWAYTLGFLVHSWDSPEPPSAG